MLSLDQLNQARHAANECLDRDGDGPLLDLLETIAPSLPPMLSAIVVEVINDRRDHGTETIEP